MKKVTPHMIEAFLMKNWFQVALIVIIGMAAMRQGSDSLVSMEDHVASAEVMAKRPIEKMGMSFMPDLFSEKEPTKEVVKVKKAKSIKNLGADSRAQAFIERFAEVAIQEQSKYNIPASIILANGILLSDLGLNSLATDAQNFFMVPCTRSWDGDSMEIGDGCYRWYGSPWESFRDHSLFICRESGNDAMKVKNMSIIEWAKNIEKIGWTNLAAKDILKTIRKYNLMAFDA